MSIVGGALLTPLQGKLLDLGGAGYEDVSYLGFTEMRFSFVITLICFIVIAVYGKLVYSKYNKIN